MKASVIVPTYNRREYLERTLQGLLKQTFPRHAFEIIVVDDCSTDDTADFMKRIVGADPDLVYLRHAENMGRVVTRNDGIEAAKGEILIFLDNDNVPDPKLVEAHVQYHEANSGQHVVVMGNVSFAPELLEGRNFARYLQSRYLGFRTPREKLGLDYTNLPPRCLGTLNCSVRRADLISIGMLNANFRYYGGEDEYLGYCLNKAGIRIMFGEDARSVHYDDLSVQRYKKKMIETACTGYRVILKEGEEYFEGTQIKFLLPVDPRKDSLRRILAKLATRVVLRPLVLRLLERWAILTDNHPRLYFQPCYRLLTAGWGYLGLRSDPGFIDVVGYGKSSA
jgi:glycosyltransferase involved in cell wall biosynthesis